MLEETPYEVFLEPRSQIPTDLIEIQGNDIFKEFIKAKRRKSRTQMLLYMFYLGEILENDENPNRDVDVKKHWPILRPEYRAKLDRAHRIKSAKDYLSSKMFHAKLRQQMADKEKEAEMNKKV